MHDDDPRYGLPTKSDSSMSAGAAVAVVAMICATIVLCVYFATH